MGIQKERLNADDPDLKCHDAWREGFMAGYGYACKILDPIYIAEKFNRWIPLEEEMPQEGAWVLIKVQFYASGAYAYELCKRIKGGFDTNCSKLDTSSTVYKIIGWRHLEPIKTTDKLIERLEHYLNTTPKEQIKKDWEATKEWDNIGPKLILHDID